MNNTGGPQTGTLESLTDEDWMESFQLHLLSYIRLLKEALPYLKTRCTRVKYCIYVGQRTDPRLDAVEYI